MFSVGAEQQKNNHLIICGNCWKVLPGQKHTQEVGGGDENGRKSALIMFLYQGADLAPDRDSVLWTSCSSDGSCGPPSPLSMSVSSCIHPILCHRLSLLPIQDASYFPWLDSSTKKCPNRAWHPHVDRTQLFISIIPLIFPLLIVAYFFSSLHLFVCFSGLIICSMEHRIKSCTHIS